MCIIGCDYHPSVQQIACVDTESGECGELRLTHCEAAGHFSRCSEFFISGGPCPATSWIVSLASAAWMLLACGASDPRPLQSITVSPASADAQDYPGDKAPFVASGHYNSTPTTVTPLQANWAAVSEQLVNGILTSVPSPAPFRLITPELHSAAAASGTYAVIAWDLLR